MYVTLHLAQELLGAAVLAEVLQGLEPGNLDARFVAEDGAVAWAEHEASKAQIKAWLVRDAGRI